VSAPPLWATSADGECADTKPTELDALRSHLHQCAAAHTRMAAFKGEVLRLRGFVLGRLVSSVALVLGLPLAAWLLLRL
jgi:hypothetical protein